MAVHEDELRADLQQYYGVDIDRAMAGEHSAQHVSALVTQLPSDARLRHVDDDDREWDLDRTLLAALLNCFNALLYGMSDKRKRGRRPQLVGPSYMTGDRDGRKLDAQVMTVDELNEILSMARR